MSDSFSFQERRKKAIIAILIKMADVDVRIDPKESAYIAGIAQQMGLSMDDLRAIVKNPDDFPFEVPSNEQERMTILYYILFLTKADGEISKEEESLCLKMGLRLGFNHNMVVDLISVLRNHAKEEVPPEEMLDKVRKYLN